MEKEGEVNTAGILKKNNLLYADDAILAAKTLRSIQEHLRWLYSFSKRRQRGLNSSSKMSLQRTLRTINTYVWISTKGQIGRRVQGICSPSYSKIGSERKRFGIGNNHLFFRLS